MKLRLKRKVKFTLYIVFIIFLVSVLAFEIYLGNYRLKKKSITYSKQGDINYVTYLKNNNHYGEKYLEDGFNLVASLVDYFKLDYTYSYTLNEDIDYELEYDVVAYLEVYDSDEKTKPIDHKDYKLVDKVNAKRHGQVISVNLYNQVIDYETYNKIVQDWKKEVSPDANLTITFNVKWKGYSNIIGKEVSDNYSNTFIVPISQKTINIANPVSTNDSGVIVSDQKLADWFLVLVGSTGLLLLIVVIGLINLIIKTNRKKSKYEQKVNKILREFDRAITEAKGQFIKKEDEHYIEVKEFMELMDVHDNLNEPIIYYKLSNNKCIFIVRNGTDIYYSMIKRDEFDD